MSRQHSCQCSQPCTQKALLWFLSRFFPLFSLTSFPSLTNLAPVLHSSTDQSYLPSQPSSPPVLHKALNPRLILLCTYSWVFSTTKMKPLNRLFQWSNLRWAQHCSAILVSLLGNEKDLIAYGYGLPTSSWVGEQKAKCGSHLLPVFTPSRSQNNLLKSQSLSRQWYTYFMAQITEHGL